MPADFDYQWKNLPSSYIEYNADRVNEFLSFTGIRRPSRFGKGSELKGKICLDAGCGNGRYTFAMLKLGAARVDSIDVSPEAIEKCRRVNMNAQVKSIFELGLEPVYDFVLCWGVLNHVDKPREGFRKVALQLKKGRKLHIMVYHKETQAIYEEGRKIWPGLDHDSRIELCNKMVLQKGGDIHGWWDALNPMYNWSWDEDEISKWFKDEGFTNIRLIQRLNINMQGTKI